MIPVPLCCLCSLASLLQQVYVHSSVPGRNRRCAIWSSKLARLGLALTQGSAPENGTSLAVVGAGEFDANTLLEELAEGGSLVLDQWLVDCAAAHRVLDMTPYQLEPRQHRGDAAAAVTPSTHPGAISSTSAYAAKTGSATMPAAPLAFPPRSSALQAPHGAAAVQPPAQGFTDALPHGRPVKRLRVQTASKAAATAPLLPLPAIPFVGQGGVPAATLGPLTPAARACACTTSAAAALPGGVAGGHPASPDSGVSAALQHSVASGGFQHDAHPFDGGGGPPLQTAPSRPAAPPLGTVRAVGAPTVFPVTLPHEAARVATRKAEALCGQRSTSRSALSSGPDVIGPAPGATLLRGAQSTACAPETTGRAQPTAQGALPDHEAEASLQQLILPRSPQASARVVQDAQVAQATALSEPSIEAARGAPLMATNMTRSAEASARVSRAAEEALATRRPVPSRPWVPPRLGSPPGAPVVVPEAPQPLGWWDPTRGLFVAVPDHEGRPRGPRPQADRLAPAVYQTADDEPAGGPAHDRVVPVGSSRTSSTGTAGAGGVWQAAGEARTAIRVVSYNCLGNTACTFSFQKDKDLTPYRLWRYRGLRLWQEIEAYDSDVVCLQEVDGSSYLRLFGPKAREAGYGTIYLPRGDRTPAGPDFQGYWQPGPFGPRGPPVESDGMLLLYRRRRLRLVAAQAAALRDWVPPLAQQQACEAEPFWEGAISQAQGGVGALVAVLQLRKDATEGDGDGEQGRDEKEEEEEEEAAAAHGLGATATVTTGTAEETEDPEALEELEEGSGWLEEQQPLGVGSFGDNWHGPPALGPCADAAWVSGECYDGRGGVATGANAATAFSGGAPCGIDTGNHPASHGGRSEHVSRPGLAALRCAAAADGDGGDGGGDVFCVVNTHLWWDPRVPDRKVAEAQLVCTAACGILGDMGFTNPQDVPMVLCGDLNSLPARFSSDKADRVAPGGCLVSGVYELLTHGSLGSDHPHHPARLRRPTEDPERLSELRFHAAGLRLASAYKAGNGREPAATISTKAFRGCLDYVWVSRGRWAVSAVLEMPYRYGSDPRADFDDEYGGRVEPDSRNAAAAAAAAAMAGPARTCDLQRHGSPGAGDTGAEGIGAGPAHLPGGTSAALASTGPCPDLPNLPLGMVSRRPVWELGPMPNAEWPSDHLAVGAELVLL